MRRISQSGLYSLSTAYWSCKFIKRAVSSGVAACTVHLYAHRDGADHCEKTISVGVFEQWLHAEVHGVQSNILLMHAAEHVIIAIKFFDVGFSRSGLRRPGALIDNLGLISPQTVYLTLERDVHAAVGTIDKQQDLIFLCKAFQSNYIIVNGR